MIVGDIIEEVVQRHAINGFRKGLEVLMYVDLPKEPLLADSHCLEVVLNNCESSGLCCLCSLCMGFRSAPSCDGGSYFGTVVLCRA